MAIEPQNLRGSLKTFHFPDLLVHLHKLETSGILSATDGPVTRQVFFRAGLPTAARSNVPSERLGELLLAGGVITSEQLARARSLQEESQSTVASALLALGAVSRNDLFVWTRRQFVGIVLSLFSCVEGEFRFEENELSGDRYCFEVDFPALLALGIRSIKNAHLLRKMLGEFGQVPVPTNRFPEHRRIAFNADELPVIRRIDGVRTIAQIVDTSGADLLVAIQTLLVFRHLGLIRMTVDFREEEMAEAAAASEATPAPLASLDVEAAIAGDDFLVSPTVIALPDSDAVGAFASSGEHRQEGGSGALEATSAAALAAQLKSVEPEKGGWLDALIGDAEEAPEGRGTSRVVTGAKTPAAKSAEVHPWAIGSTPPDPPKPASVPTPPVSATPLDPARRQGFPWALTTAVLLAALGVSLVAFTPWGADVRTRLFTGHGQEAPLASRPPQAGASSTAEPQEVVQPAVASEAEQTVSAAEPAAPLAMTEKKRPAVLQEERPLAAPEPLPATPKMPPVEEEELQPLAQVPVLAAAPAPPPPMPAQKVVPVEPEAPVAAAVENVAPEPAFPEPVVDLARVLDLTHETGEDFVRVEVIVDRPIGHGKYALPEQNMVYLSLRKTRVPRSFENTSFRIDSDLVRNVRIAQFDHDTARLVLTCRGLPLVSVYNQENPYRVVLLVTSE